MKQVSLLVSSAFKFTKTSNINITWKICCRSFNNVRGKYHFDEIKYAILQNVHSFGFRIPLCTVWCSDLVHQHILKYPLLLFKLKSLVGMVFEFFLLTMVTKWLHHWALTTSMISTQLCLMACLCGLGCWVCKPSTLKLKWICFLEYLGSIYLLQFIKQQTNSHVTSLAVCQLLSFTSSW